MTDTPASSMTRRHDLDWLRVIAFACLIFYHVGMFYVTWDWHVKSVHESPFLQPVMALMNPWRLALLFFISGVAVRFLSDRTARSAFAWSRLVRLGVPLLFGIAVIVPPQSYFELLEKREIAPDYFLFWAEYLRPDQSFSIITPTYNHLWYVAYLLTYTLLILPVLPALRRAAEPAMRAAAGAPWRLILLIPLPFMLYELTLSRHFPNTNIWWDDWAQHAHRFSVFLLGYWAAKSQHFWRSVNRVRLVAPGLALLLGVLLIIFWQSEAARAALTPLRPWIGVYYAWFCILTLLAAAQRFLNRPSRALAYLTRAVFPYFIVHQTIIVAFGWWVTRQDIPAPAEFLLVCAVTAAGCALTYEIVRRVKPLRPVFGLALNGPRTR